MIGRLRNWRCASHTALTALFTLLACSSGEATAPPPPPDPPSPPVTVTAVELRAPQTTVPSNGTIQLSVTVRGSNGSVLNDRAITWRTSNASIASVAATGLVTAASVRGGNPEPVTITAIVENRSGSVALQVMPVTIATLTLASIDTTLRVGEQRQLVATASDSAQQPLTGRTLAWSSTLPTVATVDSTGLVRAVSPGQTRIEVRSEGMMASVNISVPVVPMLTLEVRDAQAVTLRGDQITLAWESAGVTSCEASGAWNGSKSVADALQITLNNTGLHTFALRCTGIGGEVVRETSITARRPVSRQSYDNFKDAGVFPSSLPAFFGTTAYGDFFGTGTSALLTAELRYDPSKQSIAESPRSLTSWFTMRADRTWLRTPMPVMADVPSCVHPRKVLVTEINNDRRPDVVMMCHGWDGMPFPGELNLSLLSQPDGSYRQRALSPDSGFYHGGATCDLDGDGGLDLIMVDGRDGRGFFVHELLPDGSLRPRTTHPLSALRGGGFYSVECLDIDEDGRADLVFGGHEPGMPHYVQTTRIWYALPGGSYREVEIPGVPNEHIVLDFTVTGTGPTRTLWVLRTSSNDGIYYVGNALQRIHLSSMTSSVAFASRNVVQLGWVVPYYRDGALYIGAESSGFQPGPVPRVGWEYRVPP